MTKTNKRLGKMFRFQDLEIWVEIPKLSDSDFSLSEKPLEWCPNVVGFSNVGKSYRDW